MYRIGLVSDLSLKKITCCFDLTSHETKAVNLHCEIKRKQKTQ